MSRSHRLLPPAILALGIAAAAPVSAQCMLANPSFELAGSGGNAFAGWNQFGPVGTSTEATHGSDAARVAGPNTGNWDVAGVWQALDTSPGERWAASVRARHLAASPLSGQSRAILNIEWRDAGGNLIGYESHDVADAATPPGEVVTFSTVSQPAPAGAAKTRLLLGVLQGPADPVPAVVFDQATFESLGPPTLDELQWGDFPGGRTLAFSGRTWRVKGPGYYGPGPNLFSDSPAHVWVDAGGSLHLTVRRAGGQWYSTEAVLEQPLGYGDYVFTTRGRLDTLHPSVVLGLFIWQYGPCYEPANGWWNPYNEIDVEFSRWGNPANDVGQFVAQPYDYPGNLRRFAATFSSGEVTSHAFRWLPDRVEYRSWRGGPLDEAPGAMIHAWTYTGPHVPRPEQPRVHVNLWQFENPPSTDQEVVLDAFTFVPAETAVVDVPRDPGAGAAALALHARPNPFLGRTAIAWSLPADADVDLAVFDVAGRRVRTLARGVRTAGRHEAGWDGRDESGARVAPGVYLIRYRAGAEVTARRLVVLQ